MPLTRSNLVSLVFPPQCFGCETQLDPDRSSKDSAGRRNRANCESLADPRYWCSPCWYQLQIGQRPQCEFCGGILIRENPILEGCPLCHRIDLRFDSAVALAGYDGLVQELIVKMKNRKDDALAIQLGRLLARWLQDFSVATTTDVVIPVPTHWKRRMLRGFACAEIIAATVAGHFRFPILNRAVQCVRTTAKQGTLSITQRHANVKNAFRVKHPDRLAGKNILLIDDVMTSGATTSEVSRVLKSARVNRVDVAVIARGGVK